MPRRAKQYPTSIRMARETKQLLQKYAEAAHRPLSELIMHILKEWLAFQQRQGK